MIDKSKKTDDPTCENLVETVTLETTHEYSNKEFLNHKEALSDLFSHFEFALKFNHLQRDQQIMFFFHWIRSVSWGISSATNFLDRTLGVHLSWENDKNMPQLVDMKFMQVMIFLNHHSQMTFRISNQRKRFRFIFGGNSSMWPFKLVLPRFFMLHWFVYMQTTTFVTKLFLERRYVLHLSQEVADVEKLIGREIE